MLFVAYAACSTCKKAEKWLKEQGLSFETRPIKTEPPAAEELSAWQEKSGLPLRRFFNTSGAAYRERKVKDMLPNLSRQETLALLASDGMLVKRPILVDGDTVLVGFREEEWKKALGG